MTDFQAQLQEAAKKGLEALRADEDEANRRLTAIRDKKLAILRKAAAKLGLVAENLVDLKSDSGRAFVAVDPGRSYMGSNVPKRAAVWVGDNKYIEEEAYRCEHEYGPDSGCGWVKGEPSTSNYDDIGPLSGSAGTRYYCYVCSQMIGELRTRVS